MKRTLFIILVGALSMPSRSAAQSAPPDEDLRVLADWMLYSDAENGLYHHFREQAERMLERRAAGIEAVQSALDWSARQQRVRSALARAIGSFPDRTPLAARITGVIERPGFRVERLVYQSQPSFYVTAALFVPKELEAPAPAILFSSGHSVDGFRTPVYQTMILNLVRNGIIVLAFDPAGQGERVQYFDDVDEPRFGPTKQHSYPGAQQLLLGHSPARLMIWDAIRGIDYLVSRQEVDPHRIGVAGRSGGGTQSALVAAVDDRVYAAAPEAYITSYQRLFASRGPQDAEQNLFHGIALGLDHADLLEVRAPKPTLVVTTTRDIFSIQGARETVAEAKRAFGALGATSNLEKVEDDEAHASTLANREAMVDFFLRRFGLARDSAEDPDLRPLTAEELVVTPTGQVATSLRSETVFSLNLKNARPFLERLETSRDGGHSHFETVRREAARLSGFELPRGSGEPVFTGRYSRDGYSVEKYFIPGEGDYVVPMLVAVPQGEPPFDAVVYLHPAGKGAEARTDGEIEVLVQNGYVVAAPDLLGIGEMGPGRFEGDAQFDGTSYNTFFASMLVGRSIVGVRASDTLRVASFLRGRVDVGSRVSAIARGALGPVLLHAAALGDDAGVDAVAILGSVSSYRSLVFERDYRPAFIHASVAGALTAYDLPDLAASLASRPLYIGGAVDGAGRRLDRDGLERETAFIDSTYRSAGASRHLVIETDGTIEGVLHSLGAR